MINQARTLLVVALLFVVYLLWQGWQHDYASTPPSQPVVGAVPASTAGVPEATAPQATAPAQAAGNVPETAARTVATPAADLITASTDVLRLKIDPRGGTIVAADLLAYPETVKRGSPPVRLLNDSPGHFYVAQSGLVGADGSSAPNHLAEFTATAKDYSLAQGQKQVTVALNWRDPATGISVAKRYTLTRGSYVVTVDQEVDNHGSKAWHANAYLQLVRSEPPPPKKHFLEFFNPESLSFTGAAWYSPDDKFQKLAFGKFEKNPLDSKVAGGWVAMSQRFFLGAWIPAKDQTEHFSSVVVPAQGADAKPHFLIRTLGPGLSVAPGASATTSARLYVGPKLQNELAGVAPGLNLTVDYGMFTVIAQPLFWILSKLHSFVGNWGVAIILLVLIIQVAIYKLTEAQYMAGARMRKLQPRMAALKERFGDDKQKMQQAMMELYKKEKINPLSGCLPTLVTLPIFFALYYVLIFSVELRHATFLWIPDLSAADPLFILPILYALTMLGTTFLTPAQGMDPNTAKMMKVMPVLSAVLFFFFPAGLTLYYAVRGICMLAQQWHVTRKVERADAHAKA